MAKLNSNYIIKHQTTTEIETKAKKILDALNDWGNKDLFQGVDISIPPYSNGETTLKEALENLSFICNRIISNLDVIDKMGNFRSNFNSYLDQLNVWLTNNSVTANYQNIINNIENMFQWIGQWGMSLEIPNQKEIDKINAKINTINQLDSKTIEIQSLKNDLQIFKDSADKLDQAKNIKDFFENRSTINAIDKVANEVLSNKEKAEKLLIQAEEVLGKSADTITKEFSDLASKHSKNSNMWLIGVFVSIFLFLVNLIISHLVFNGFAGSDIFEFNFNKADVRIWVLFILVSAWFVLKNNIKETIRDTFKSKNIINFILSIIIPFTIMIVIISLLPEKISINIPSFAGLKFETSTYEGLLIYLLTRITIFTPSVLLLFLTSKYFGQNNMLKEEYEYKSATMRTFSGIIQNALNLNSDFDTNKTLNNLIEKIYSYPRKNISKFPHEKSNIIDPIDMNKIVEILKIGK